MHLASRGRERMVQFKKSDFKTFIDENGAKYWKLVKGGETKCHKDDSEDVDGRGGRIYFTENALGLNSGQYLEDFMKKLHPDCKNLMQRPKRPSKKPGKFKLENNPDIW